MVVRRGFSIPSDCMTLADVPALARAAEAWGYTDCWSFEINIFDAFTPLAAAAATTRRMRVGTAIVPAYFRQPGLLAMHAAAMADLAPGRFVLGIGASTPTVVEQWMGIPFGKPVTTVRWVAGQTRRLLAGEKVDGMRIGRPPAVPVPIWLAALGDGMLAAAREVGDGLCLFMVGPRFTAQLLGPGGPAEGLDSMCRVTVIPGSGEAVRATARRAITGYAIVPFYARAMARQGFGEEVAAITAAWAAGDRAGAAGQVSDAMVSELLLTGSDDEIRAGLQRYHDAGLGCPVLAVAVPDPDPAARRLEHDRLLQLLATG